jgi:hypothetical protein
MYELMENPSDRNDRTMITAYPRSNEPLKSRMPVKNRVNIITELDRKTVSTSFLFRSIAREIEMIKIDKEGTRRGSKAVKWDKIFEYIKVVSVTDDIVKDDK